MLNGFAGKLFLDGRKATEDDAKRLAQNLPVPKGMTVVSTALGFLALAAAGTSRAIRQDSKQILTGSGSIYNRKELHNVLNCREDADDLELMEYAFRKWRSEAPYYLDGDWMLAAYDQEREELVLARSWGISALYYCKRAGFLAFATHPAVLAEMPEIPREPDLRSLTQILCSLPLSPAKTCYRGISQLEPAAMMKTVRGQSIKKIWWRPSDIRIISGREDKETFETFLGLFSAAVAKRLRTGSKVGATLSSGLDSSAICLLAARNLSQSGKVLHAWTAVPHYIKEAYAFDGWYADEGALAAKVAASGPNICHYLVEAADADPIEAVRLQVFRSGRPQSAATNLYWIDKINSLAAEAGCGILLSGQCGNYTVSWTPPAITLFPKKKYFPGTPYPKYLWLLKKLMAYRLALARKKAGEFLNGSQQHQVFNPRFTRTEIFKQGTSQKGFPRCPSHADEAEVQMGYFDAAYHSSFFSGVEQRDPTMDKQLNEFVLSLPETIFFQDGLDRRLMRLGLQGILPDEIRLNRKRGCQGSDIVPRIRNFSRQAELALVRVEASELARETLNIEQLKLILKNIGEGDTGIDIMNQCSGILLPGLSAGLFLASFDTELELS